MSTQQLEPNNKSSRYHHSHHHGSIHHHGNHHHSSNSRYYSSNSSNYRSNNYNNNQSSSSTSSTTRYLRSDSTCKTLSSQHNDMNNSIMGLNPMNMLNQDNPDMINNNIPNNLNTMFRSNSLRQIKTDNDLIPDQNINMNNSYDFYRNQHALGNNQFRNRIPSNNLQFNNYNNNNGKRFSSNSFNYMQLNTPTVVTGGYSNNNSNNSFIDNEQILLNTNLVSLSEYNLNDQIDQNDPKKQSDFEDTTSNESSNSINGDADDKLNEETNEWSTLQEPRYKFIKNNDRTMFDLIFKERKNFEKIAQIFGSSKHNYLEEVRCELAGTNEDPEANTFILVNCLLNRSFSKIRLNRFFNSLNQITNDRSTITYLNADIERRQRLINDSKEETNNNISQSTNKSYPHLRNCIDMLKKYNIMPNVSK